MTNGEKLKSIFSNIDSLDAETGIMIVKWADDTTKFFKTSWWNAEYKEPTTKNDLGVDTDKLIADCEKMSFDFELFGRPMKALLLDAVKNIVKELPLVTPQEPRCKNCKWWKDNDGVYRRGVEAESLCPINRQEVYEGNGYCFLFEQQESEK